MAAYVVLVNFMGQGASTGNNPMSRLQDFEKSLEAAGGRKIGIWGTMGAYDMVMILEAPNDEAMAQQLIQFAMNGNLRTQTLRAFSEEEMGRIMQGLQQQSSMR
jgi:uncharacterized protein with GYD domain